MLGLPGVMFGCGYTFSRQTLLNNVSLVSPELLRKVPKMVVEVGHEQMAGRDPVSLAGRAESFVAKTYVAFPRDYVNLCKALDKQVKLVSQAANGHGMDGCRQW